MTIINIIKKSEDIIGFEVIGHAEYNVSGPDIVCAAISAVTQAIVIGLGEVLKRDMKVVKHNGYLLCELIHKGEHEVYLPQILFKTMLLSLKEVAIEYSDNVKIIYTPYKEEQDLIKERGL